MRTKRVGKFVQAARIFKSTPRLRQRKFVDPQPLPPNQQEISERSARNVEACKDLLQKHFEKDKSR